jgi:YfiH family protein
MLQVRRDNQLTLLRSELLDRIPGIVHGFSTRRSERSDFTLSSASSNPLVEINRIRFCAAIGAPGWPILKLKQIHSGIVVEMADTSAAGNAIEGDAAVTQLCGAALAVQTADCVPILIADTEARMAAAIHAGWRGTAAGIAATAIARLCETYGVRPKNLTAAIGPHIGVCCYEVGPEVAEAIALPAAFERRADWKQPHLNLLEANRTQLLNAGIPEGQIDASSWCTRCRDDLFHSFRRDGKRTGHMLSIVGLAP